MESIRIKDRILAKAELLLALLLSLLVGLLGTLGRVYMRYEVEGDSMLPTLAPGDRVLVRKGKRFRAGDIVVVKDPRDTSRLLSKRVEGLSDIEAFVLGDNPNSSTDSRHFGPVPLDLIVGTVKMRYYPLDGSGTL